MKAVKLEAFRKMKTDLVSNILVTGSLEPNATDKQLILWTLWHCMKNRQIEEKKYSEKKIKWIKNRIQEIQWEKNRINQK